MARGRRRPHRQAPRRRRRRLNDDDRARWDERYRARGPAALDEVGPPPELAGLEDAVPTAGAALDIACGAGTVAVWLARRGVDVLGVDVSPVAVGHARDLAARAGVGARFEVHDLDTGLPPGPPAAVLVCRLFRDACLDAAVVDRLAPGGVLLASALTSGRFAVAPGDLAAAFAALEPIAGGDGWFLGRRPRT